MQAKIKDHDRDTPRPLFVDGTVENRNTPVPITADLRDTNGAA